MALPDTPGLALLRDRARAVVVSQSEGLVLAAVLLAAFLLPLGLPLGIGVQGVVSGSAIALEAIGMVLVYRANRIICFALPAAGALGGAVFSELNKHTAILLIGREVCGSCVPVAKVPQFEGKAYNVAVGLPGWAYQLDYWLAMLAGALAAVLVLMLVFAVVHIARLTKASRLVVTVFTIGASQVMGLLSVLVFDAFHDVLPISPTLPFHWKVTVSGTALGAPDILTVVALVGASIGVAVYLTRTAYGMLLTGAAENPARAQTLGVNTVSVNSRAWLFASVLAAVGGLLAQVSIGSAGSAAGLVPVLAAAVVGGFTRVPLTIAAALVLGIVERSTLWSFNTSGAVDAVALVVIVVTLLVQRARRSRVDTVDTGFTQSLEFRPVPRELRRLAPVVRWATVLRIAGIAVALVLPWLLSPSQTTLTVAVVVYAMVGMSLLVLTGWAGQISLGQMGIAAVGAYITAMLHAPFPIPLLVGGLAGAAAALIVGLPALRLRGLHLAVTTLAFGAATTSLLLDTSQLGRYLPTHVARPTLLGLRLGDDRTFYYVALALLGLVVAAVMGMRRSRTGRVLIACRDNEALAQAYAVNLVRARLSAFMVSGFIAAIAGGMYAYAAYGVSAANFGVQQSISVFVLVVIGGLGSIAGPLLGALYVGATTVFSSNTVLALAATGLGLVVVLLFAPGGISQVVYGVRDAFLRRVADRYKIDVPSLYADRAGNRLVVAPIAAKTASGGATAFVPVRYRPDQQWAVERLQREVARG